MLVGVTDKAYQRKKADGRQATAALGRTFRPTLCRLVGMGALLSLGVLSLMGLLVVESRASILSCLASFLFASVWLLVKLG